MADITVRKPRFDFSDTRALEIVPGDKRGSAFWIGLSLTMPYLEPYLIRTLRDAVKSISDPVLAEDLKRFNAQESHHYRNHALFNDALREQVSPECATEIRSIEDALEADYRRYNETRSLRFNIGYAEGFEAMTSAMAFTCFAVEMPETLSAGFRPLFEWHLAEELEHRTVTFEAYEHLVGNYPYRVFRGLRSQAHYLGYIQRFYRCIMNELGESQSAFYLPPSLLPGWWRYLRTLPPWYHPGKLEIPGDAKGVLAKYAV